MEYPSRILHASMPSGNVFYSFLYPSNNVAAVVNEIDLWPIGWFSLTEMICVKFSAFFSVPFQWNSVLNFIYTGKYTSWFFELAIFSDALFNVTASCGYIQAAYIQAELCLYSLRCMFSVICLFYNLLVVYKVVWSRNLI